MVFRKLQNKFAVTELFREISQKVGEREGGYTRILKTGNRLGDNAEMCIIELVDYNETYMSEKGTKSTKKRTRRGKSKTKVAETVVDKVEEVVETEVKQEVDSEKNDTTGEIEDKE
jgi:large subunit ribosomal protein L17